MGSPTGDLFFAPKENRTVKKAVRFTPSEWAEVLATARRYGLAPSRVVRRAALRTIRKRAKVLAPGAERVKGAR